MQKNSENEKWWTPAMTAGILSVIFAMISARTVSVGWIFCCAVTLVAAIAAGLLTFLSKRIRVSALLGVGLGLIGVIFVVWSYHHAGIAGAD